MFSDEQGDRGASPPASVIVLSVDQFEVIFQVTYQLPNFQESRLMELGCTTADLQTLVGALREIDARVAGASRVCIWLRDDEAEFAVEVQISSGEVNDVGAPGAEVMATLPLRIGRRWYALAQLVVSALGSRELFLRTGYGSDEVQAAVAGLDLD
ncbi:MULTISPECIES: hypothetical protein [Streptomyces]|uniref:Uncharacterized protein n=1 Tax=Streptomyces dengpaensis TaxID=2049881 RepID=A0ABM6SU52_9ACTN|nr:MULTISPECIES: hypothetical protein [Streptomyces]AVH58230.1 hypothetical protein C4B68_23435 [Streptomyces dengpaensis]PIB08087.1 hypothetical protein B1C81_16910 [Streptomyces sp. HG99]